MTENLAPYLGYTTTVLMGTFGVLSGQKGALLETERSLLSNVGARGLTALAVAWVSVSTLYFLFRVERGFVTHEDRERESLAKDFLRFYGVLFLNGFTEAASTPARRLLYSGWLLMVIVTMTAICARLSAQLAVTDKPKRIDRVQDVLDYPGLKPYVTLGQPVHNFFQTATDPRMRQIWQRTRETKAELDTLGFSRLYDIFRELKEGKAVLLANRNIVLPSLVSFMCWAKFQEYYLSREHFFPQPYVLLYRKGAPQRLKDKLNYAFIRLGEAGLFGKEFSRYHRRSELCLDIGSRSVQTPLNFKSVKPSMLLFIYGTLFNCLALAVEFLTVACSNAGKYKRNGLEAAA